jgi:restriction endonuclease
VGDNFIELSNGETVFVGNTLGGLSDEVVKVQIKKTIEEHFLKEKRYTGAKAALFAIIQALRARQEFLKFLY